MLRSLTIIFIMTHCLKMEQIFNKDFSFFRLEIRTVYSSRETGILICIKVHKDCSKLEIQHGYLVSLILCIENDNSHGKSTK
jgi:hypothetical protein